MPKKPLPTGEEPPKGFESVVETNSAGDDVRIDCVFISQLAAIEFAEINKMRELAYSTVTSPIGLTNQLISFEQEVNLLPGKLASDKLFFRSYKNGVLTGYALVVMAWPNAGEWVIQHLTINPDYRLQGIGSMLVKRIENFAKRSAIDSDRIFAIPQEQKGTPFWQNHGYKVESSRQLIQVEGLDHELVVYGKEL